MACPICGSEVNRQPHRDRAGRESYFIDCRRCGQYLVTEEAYEDLPGAHRGNDDDIARIAYGVRRMARGDGPPFVTTELVDAFLKRPLPSVFEQANNLIEWLGNNCRGPGEIEQIEATTHQFIAGAKTPNGFGLLVEHLYSEGVLTGFRNELSAHGHADAVLTFRGWKFFDELRRGAVDSRKAFMAMQYGDAVLDRIVTEVFRLAVAQTGFALVRLDDEPRAGLIDDRLRVEIRASRFLIADLTHQNAGAYWEAGYAEGLGKQVIYTCERGVFRAQRTHFDTNHHLTVIWDVDNPHEAAELLKATIRATLPEVAKQQD